MCGIAGFQISEADKGRFDSRKLSEALLKEIVSRGSDATGAAWTQKGKEGREVWYSKQAVRAERFIANGGLNSMPTRSKTVLLHTRLATQGHKSNPDNNHPIVVPGVVGVHNGVVMNDDELFKEHGYKRIAEVDSEAAFHLIANRTKMDDALTQLRGSAALAWTEATDDKWDGALHLARCNSSPLALAQTKAGSVVFASTKELLEAALKEMEVKDVDVFVLNEWTYVRVLNGVIHEWVDLPKPAPDVFKFSSSHWMTQPQLPWSLDSQRQKDDRWMRDWGWK